jgi:hypothetical protein
MKHPFENLSPHTQRTTYWVSLAATFILIGVLQSMAAPYCDSLPGEPLKYNIIQYEFAGTVEKAQEIVDSWGAEGRAGLTKQILVDYAFAIAYPTAIAFAILAVLKNTRNKALLAGGRVLAWLQPLAGLLDAVENYALLQMLKGVAYAPMPQVAYWCAAPKFVIVVAGIFFVLIFAGLGYTRDSEPADS